MLLIISATSLLFSACAMLYQADTRRSAFEWVRKSKTYRFGMRVVALGLGMLTLYMSAQPQGWERGVPVWLCIFTVVFVLGLFLAAQKPNWHPYAGIGSVIIGAVAGMGAGL